MLVFNSEVRFASRLLELLYTMNCQFRPGSNNSAPLDEKQLVNGADPTSSNHRRKLFFALTSMQTRDGFCIHVGHPFFKSVPPCLLVIQLSEYERARSPARPEAVVSAWKNNDCHHINRIIATTNSYPCDNSN